MLYRAVPQLVCSEAIYVSSSSHATSSSIHQNISCSGYLLSQVFYFTFWRLSMTQTDPHAPWLDDPRLGSAYFWENRWSLEKPKNKTLSKSSSKAEYCALASTLCEIQWISYLLEDFEITTTSVANLSCDNQSTTHCTQYQFLRSNETHWYWMPHGSWKIATMSLPSSTH